MRSFTRRLAFAVLLASLCLHARAGAQLFDDVSREWFNEKFASILSYDKQLTRNPQNFLYATCDDSGLPKQMDCEFVLNYLNASADEPINLTCAVKLIASAEGRNVKTNLRMESLGGSSVLFSWTESTRDLLEVYEKFGVLRMSTCEVVYSREFYKNLTRQPLALVTYDNAFEIIDYSNDSCSPDVCRVTYDNEINLESYSSLPGNLTFWQLLPVDHRSLADGYFALGGNVSIAVVASYIGVTGEARHLMTLPSFLQQYHIAGYARGKFGICLNLERDKFKCVQLDTNANKLIDRDFDLDSEQKILAVHNLKGGGFLLLVGRCSDYFDFFSCKNVQGLKIVSGHGSPVPVEVPGPDFECEHRVFFSGALRIFESDDAYCFYYSVACGRIENGKDSKSLKFSRKCTRISSQ